MPDPLVESVVAELLRRRHQSPRLEPGERVTLDFRSPPTPGDLLLVYTGGVFALERSRPKRRRRGWIVAVVRLARSVS